MTNFEKYKDAVLSMIDDKHGMFGVVDGKPVPCKGIGCFTCQLYRDDTNVSCTEGFVKWLYQEYEEKPKLSVKSYHFLKSFPDDAEIIITDAFLYVVIGGVMDAIDYFHFFPEFPDELKDGERHKVSDLLKFEVEG